MIEYEFTDGNQRAGGGGGPGRGSLDKRISREWKRAKSGLVWVYWRVLLGWQPEVGGGWV